MMRRLMDLFISCAPGLESILADEIIEKRMGTPEVVPGGVTMKGGLRSIYRANLELGCAQQVRARLGEMRVVNVGEVAKKVSKLELERWIDPARPLRIRALSRGVSPQSRLHHTGAIADAVAKGVARRVKAAPPEGAEGAHLHARLVGETLTLSVDTSGAPLHRRGYRLVGGKAPLREDIAHALVRASGWDRRSMLIDPLAGSGTIAIEAALLASGAPPGAQRDFELKHAPCFDAALWQRTLDAAQPSPRDLPTVRASDRNEGAIAACTDNAQRAGVTLELRTCSVSDAFAELPESGALVTNPPWGARTGGDVRPLYRRLAEAIAALSPEWRVAVVAPRELGRLLRLPSARMTDARGTKVDFFVREG